MDIKDVKAGAKKVSIKGWVHEIRTLGSVVFVILRDSTGMLQITVNKEKAGKLIVEKAERLNRESIIEVSGQIQKNDKAPGKIELIPESLNILIVSDPELPINISGKNITTDLNKRLDWRCIDLRKPREQAIFTIQSALITGISSFLSKEGFTQVFTPCIMGVASESGSEVFSIFYFDKEAFLRQDPQLHRQLTIAGGFKKIYDIGPAWRAEQSHTSKHLCEHRVCAVEAAFIKDEHEVMDLEEKVIIAALENVKKNCDAELKVMGVELDVPRSPFPRFSFEEVKEILKGKGRNISLDGDIDTEGERMLRDYVKEKHKSDFYFVYKFPFKIKPFYVMKQDKEGKWARSMDLYFRELELSSGGQREHRYEEILKNAKGKGMNPGEIEWFAKFFKYGVPPHGGFSIGVERLTQSILGVANIRECTLFPRDPERLMP